MGQSLRDRTGILPFPARPTPESAAPSRDSLSIDAELVTSIVAGQQLIDAATEGASEYVMKSPDGQTSVRVTLAIRESRRGTQTFDGGTLAVDWTESAIEYRGARVSLLRVELQLLGALLDANGSVVSRAALIQAAWPRADTQSRENSLAVYVCGLRKRLTAIGLPDALETVRREGYRFRPASAVRGPLAVVSTG